jgi:hypothetical protein
MPQPPYIAPTKDRSLPLEPLRDTREKSLKRKGSERVKRYARKDNRLRVSDLAQLAGFAGVVSPKNRWETLRFDSLGGVAPNMLD